MRRDTRTALHVLRRNAPDTPVVTLIPGRISDGRHRSRLVASIRAALHDAVWSDNLAALHEAMDLALDTARTMEHRGDVAVVARGGWVPTVAIVPLDRPHPPGARVSSRAPRWIELRLHSRARHAELVT
jgi:hypothetical protein